MRSCGRKYAWRSVKHFGAGHRVKYLALVCRLLKAVYGLKHTPFEWNSLLHKFLIYYGLYQLKCDSACYALITPTFVVYVAVYVDDVLIFNSDPN